MPIFVVDPGGTLLYYNEPAEAILGRRYEETGEMSMEEWATTWNPVDEEGQPLPPESQPLVIALTQHQPAHRPSMRIRAHDGVERRIAVTAFPLEGQRGRHLGAIAIFWELE